MTKTVEWSAAAIGVNFLTGTQFSYKSFVSQKPGCFYPELQYTNKFQKWNFALPVHNFMNMLFLYAFCNLKLYPKSVQKFPRSVERISVKIFATLSKCTWALRKWYNKSMAY